MIDLMQEFTKMLGDVGKLQQLVGKVQTLPLERAEHDLLANLSRSLDEQIARAKQAMPEAVGQLDKDLRETQEKLAEADRRIKAMEQDLAKAENAVPAEQAVEEITIDPGLGAVLSEELRSRFSSRGDGRKKPDHHQSGDVWKLGSGEWS